MTQKQKVLAVIGATATGKTSVAIELALALDGEIVNGDSRLFYRGMNVATSKPTLEEQCGVQHHLIDILDPDEDFSLAEYLKKAREAVDEITGQGKLPIVAGGSGQYIWALFEGWIVPDVEPDLQLRAELEKTLKEDGIESLANRLTELSPEVAEVTDLKNPRRVVRAIERAISGTPTVESNLRKADEPPFDALMIGLTVERELLHQRIRDRLASMLNKGWVNEVESLVSAGYSTENRAMSGIGYRQMIGHLSGEYDLDEAVRLTAVATNRLVRHQDNWFKQDDPRIDWFDMTSDTEKSLEALHRNALAWRLR
jgi:tRNA dimethylallyltransferase